MHNSISSIYMEHLLGKISLEEAKDKIIEQSIRTSIKDEFEALFVINSETIQTRKSNQDINDEWYDELFDIDRHEKVQSLIFVPSWFNIRAEFIKYYNRLLIEPWHHNHEFIVTLLSDIKSNTSTQFINLAVNSYFKYLHFDDLTYASFIRKCMWALADINSPDSIELLNKYRNGENKIVRQYADEQIRWLNGEKGMRYMS